LLIALVTGAVISIGSVLDHDVVFFFIKVHGRATGDRQKQHRGNLTDHAFTIKDERKREEEDKEENYRSLLVCSKRPFFPWRGRPFLRLEELPIIRVSSTARFEAG
jgi:hypothetical protein